MSIVIVEFREAELKDHGIFFSCTWLLSLTLFKYFDWLNILTGYTCTECSTYQPVTSAYRKYQSWYSCPFQNLNIK